MEERIIIDKYFNIFGKASFLEEIPEFLKECEQKITTISNESCQKIKDYFMNLSPIEIEIGTFMYKIQKYNAFASFKGLEQRKINIEIIDWFPLMIMMICPKCKEKIQDMSKMWYSESPLQKWGFGELPQTPYLHVHHEEEQPKIIEQELPINIECSHCFKKFCNKIIAKVEGLEDECKTRQINAALFFKEHPSYNPKEYTIIRKSSGFNPKSGKRKGIKIGYTNKGKYTKYCCYLIRKDS